MTDDQHWKLECFRNSMCHLTMVLEEKVAGVAKLFEYESRTAGFDAIRDMRIACDSLMEFIDALDGVENVENSKQRNEKMLTPQEEVVLKRLAAEHTPLTRTPVDLSRVHKPDTGDYLVKELAKCEKIPTINPEEDYTVISKLRDAGVLGKKEKVMEFFSRTGLGRAQLLTMSKSEIQTFVRQADANNADTGFKPLRTYAAPAPQAAPAPTVRAILT